MAIPLKELQVELQQLCSINAAIYQPLYEMTHLIGLSKKIKQSKFNLTGLLELFH